MTNNTRIYAIFGAGQIGSLVADLLLARGETVRLARRGAPGQARPGVTWMQGDASNPAFADEVCRGADVVFNCANARYDKWHELLVPLYTTIREAAGRAGAKLVTLDNLYMYGVPPTAPFDERTPMNPCSQKGELRARLATELFDAHRRGDVRATSGRASDFFGPDAVMAAVFSPRALRRLAASKPVEVMGDPDMPHAYTYMPDVAAGLIALADDDAALGRPWHLPTSWTGTTRGLVEEFAARTATEPRIRRLPNWLLRTLGIVSPLIRSVAEMTYQWQVPYVLDDSDFRRTFGIEPTPIDVAVTASLGELAITPGRTPRSPSPDRALAAR